MSRTYIAPRLDTRGTIVALTTLDPSAVVNTDPIDAQYHRDMAGSVGFSL